MVFQKLALRNLLRRPGRTATLMILVVILSFTLFAGATTILSLRRGMDSLEGRLGADIIVVPKSAKSKVNLDNILLQGTTGYFYMNSSYLDQIREVEGVERACAQIFLASLRADCCSVAIQVIGFDPEDDFTVQPWIAAAYGGKLEPFDIIIGSRVNSEIGSRIKMYEQPCRVVAQLESTGTAMDTAVYTTFDTIRSLLGAAQDLGHDLQISGDPEDVISAVYVKVAEGTSVESVANDMNVHLRKVQAVQTKTMLTGVADGMAGVSSVMGALAAAVWVLVFLISMVSFILITRERRREFAMLRVAGASRSMVTAMILKETLMICLAGGVLGTALSCVVIFPFSGLIEQKLGLPFLTPGAGLLLAELVGTLCVAVATGLLSSLWTVRRIARIDTSTILREEN